MLKNKEELSKMTIVELKSLLKEQGLPVSGKKDELIERLLNAPEPAADNTEEAAAQQDDEETEPVGKTTDTAAPANEIAPTATAAEETPASEDPAEEGQKGKRPKIEFSEATIKSMPSKVAVIKPAATVAPANVKTTVDKLKERQERFKDPDVEKAKKRAERFGTYNAELEKERARKRAARFGTFNPELETERKLKRAERFGIEEPEAKLKARAARFGFSTATTTNGATKAKHEEDGDFAAQKKARAERFGLKASKP